jgi:hypothetical protein
MNPKIRELEKQYRDQALKNKKPFMTTAVIPFSDNLEDYYNPLKVSKH